MHRLEEKRFFVLGGAGFVGSHLIARVLSAGGQVTVFDNFSSGSRLSPSRGLEIIHADAGDLATLARAMKGHDTVVHLASNPDLSKAQSDPDLDFREGTLLTRNVVEAMRVNNLKEVWYASGSGVYGDRGETLLAEDCAPLLPVSPYGASKLAGEGLIAAYAAMNGWRARIFRFANLVGPGQTHGVGYDFIRRLKKDPERLEIFGDGRQSKSYLHIEDALEAIFLAASTERAIDLFNVSSRDRITVTEIAGLATECLGLPSGKTKFVYRGGRAGWPGDVPVVQLDASKLEAIGWTPKYNSREAMEKAMKAMHGA